MHERARIYGASHRQRVGAILTLLALVCLGMSLLSPNPVRSHAATLAPWPQITLEPVRDDLDFPTFAISPPDDSGRFFLVERIGRILVRAGDSWLDTPFLDIRDRVASGGECGLLSLAFPPDFDAENPVFYVYYSANENLMGPEPDSNEPDNGCDTVVARFTVTADDANVADAGSEEQILVINQPHSNHNGGQIAFGPDAALYIGMGDGGSGGDPLEAGQRLNTLLGKMLRIRVGDTPTYTIPADNPFVGDDTARDEIWALGLRNPYRFSFDRATGDLYIADVGQNAWEEVNFQPAASAGGENYGWATVEGPACYSAGACDLDAFDQPVYVYPHEGSGCTGSVTGGYVYRGDRPALQGVYLFGDYCTRKLRGIQELNGAWDGDVLLETNIRITSFGEDSAGHLYVMGLEGAGASQRGVLYRIQVQAPPDIAPSLFAPQLENGSPPATHPSWNPVR